MNSRKQQVPFKKTTQTNKIFFTCEHGGAEIPKPFRRNFKNHKKVLKTHRALDIGALEIAKFLKSKLKAPLLFSTTSRLIVDLNRVLSSRTLLSEFTKYFSKNEKTELLNKYYHPHRDSFLKAVTLAANKNQLFIHIGVHSFTPQLNGQKRNMQLALLYDPRRTNEKIFADLWIKELKNKFPTYTIARNNPYKGYGSGINDYFRRSFSAQNYIGIELEMNQGLLIELKKSKEINIFEQKLSQSLSETKKNFDQIF